MTSLRRALRRGLFVAALASVLAVLFASPAAAHAELVSSSPSNGESLQNPPAEIQLTFTEGINLLDNGIRLIDSIGATVPTPDPRADGHTITWPMPAELKDGAYTVTWNVVSSDGHPVEGAFSFGIGAATVTAPAPAASDTGSTTAPWPVVAARLAGYLTFSLFAGVVAFVLWCSARTRTDPVLQRLARVGLVGGMSATVAAMLVQGPYTAGLPMSQLFDPHLVRETMGTPFGTAMVQRLALYAVTAVLVWRLPALVNRPVRWLVPAGVVGIAITIAATGHGNASGRMVDLGVVALHALTAGLWVGGLVVLVALGRSVNRDELHRFGALALTSVLALVLTGALNSLRELTVVAQLWETRYGLELLAKLGLVTATLGAAAVSRRRLQQDRVPVRSVRVEGVFVVGVLALTSLLSMTSPPPQTDGAVASGTRAPANAVVEMPLGDLGKAGFAVLPATTAGSELHIVLTDEQGQRLRATRVQLKVSNPGRRLAAIPVPLTKRHGVWVADYRFPLPGVWTATLTVTEPGQPAVATAGDVTISD